MLERYFDNAATTPLDPRVLEEMLPYFSEQPGNAHSMHAYGIRARAAVEEARRRIAELIRADDPGQIVFTSGATEGNNWVLNLLGAGWVSPFEHSSVREPAASLGYAVLKNDQYQVLAPEEEAPLVSVMTVNNEVGTIFDPRSLRRGASAVHTDATQAVGKLAFAVEDLDFATFSAHKFYGPKGVGVLYAKEPWRMEPMLLGGEHEGGLRSGTLNVPGIVGAGVAANIAGEELLDDGIRAAALKGIILEELQAVEDVQILGGPKASPYILSLSFCDLQGETLLLELDALGFAVGSGAACSSHKAEPSRVLAALNLPDAWSRGTIRISFGRTNTPESASQLGQVLRECVARLRKLRK